MVPYIHIRYHYYHKSQYMQTANEHFTHNLKLLKSARKECDDCDESTRQCSFEYFEYFTILANSEFIIQHKRWFSCCHVHRSLTPSDFQFHNQLNLDAILNIRFRIRWRQDIDKWKRRTNRWEGGEGWIQGLPNWSDLQESQIFFPIRTWYPSTAPLFLPFRTLVYQG